jgi:hypothetical protein
VETTDSPGVKIAVAVRFSRGYGRLDSARKGGSSMKKRTVTGIAAAVTALALVLPAAASAQKVSMYYARAQAGSVALDWATADPNNTNLWVDECLRYSYRKVSCNANVESTHYGTLHCSTISYTCSETDTITTCWKAVYAIATGAYKVRYSVGSPHCSSRTSTSRY